MSNQGSTTWDVGKANRRTSVTGIRSEYNEYTVRSNNQQENRLRLEKEKYDKAKNLANREIEQQRKFLESSLRSARRTSSPDVGQKIIQERLQAERLALQERFKSFIQETDSFKKGESVDRKNSDDSGSKIDALDRRNSDESDGTKEESAKKEKQDDSVTISAQAKSVMDEHQTQMCERSDDLLCESSDLGYLKVNDQSKREKQRNQPRRDSRAEFFSSLAAPRGRRVSIRDRRTSISDSLMTNASLSPRLTDRPQTQNGLKSATRRRQSLGPKSNFLQVPGMRAAVSEENLTMREDTQKAGRAYSLNETITTINRSPHVSPRSLSPRGLSPNRCSPKSDFKLSLRAEVVGASVKTNITSLPQVKSTRGGEQMKGST